MTAPIEYSIAAPHDPFRDRQPPYSEDAEQAVLSAMMNDADAVVAAAEIVDDSAFYAERHRRIFRAIVSLAEQSTVIDPVTLSEFLKTRGELDAAGGKDYIGYLLDVVPTSANVGYHAEIVREKSVLRSIISVGTQMVQAAFAGQGSAGELLNEVEARVFAVSQKQGADGFVSLKERLWPAMESIEALQRGGNSITGVPSGFSDLDEMTAGFQKADLIVLAARPAMGKTALALNMALYAGIESRVGVAVFSLEMSTASLVQRILTSEARVDAQRLRRGLMRDDEFPMLSRAAGILSAAPIWIDDSAGLTMLTMRSKARRLKAEHKDLGMIVVDYLQLIQSPSRSENRNQEVSQISRSLKILAKELDVPVIALSQLSRAPEKRGADHRPQLSDLRESGAIEQDADIVMFIHRPELYQGPVDGEGNSIEGQAELIVGKQRNGPTGTVRLYFHKQYTRFAPWSPRFA